MHWIFPAKIKQVKIKRYWKVSVNNFACFSCCLLLLCFDFFLIKTQTSYKFITGSAHPQDNLGRNETPALREKCPYSEIFWFVFSRIQTEYEPEKLRMRVLSPQFRAKQNISFSIDNISESTTRKFLGLVQYFVHTLLAYVHNYILKNSQCKIKQRLKMSGTGSAQKLLIAIFWKFCKFLINRIPLL